MFIISATIQCVETDAVGCFDPTKVIWRIMDEFPEAIVCIHDYGWKDYDGFQQMSRVEGSSDGLEGAIRIAESDARRRAPIYLFRLRTSTDQVIKGVAERYWVTITSDEEIPAELKHRCLAFLESLRLDPIEVKSVRLEGNDEYAD